MADLKIGVIGCGAIGREHIRRLTGAIPGATVSGCFDIYPQSAAKAAEDYGVARVYDTAASLLSSSDMEAVVLTSPDDTHAGYITEALCHDKYIFCEKPLATSSEDCERIISDEVKRGKRYIQVGFMRRYDRGYAEMKHIISSGELGAPLMIHACHRNVSQGEGFSTQMGVTNVAIHELDACRWLLGEEYIKAQVLKVRQSSRSTRGFDNPQIILLETETGCRIDVEVQCSDAYGYDIQCQVVCEKGALNLPDPAAVVTRSDARVSFGIHTDWSLRFMEAYDIELADWVCAVRARRLTGPSSWDGYAACAAADALNRSRGTGRFINVDMIEKPAIYQDYN